MRGQLSHDVDLARTGTSLYEVLTFCNARLCWVILFLPHYCVRLRRGLVFVPWQHEIGLKFSLPGRRNAMHWTLALFLASVFFSLNCWIISKKQGKELVSKENQLFFYQRLYLEHYPIRAGSAHFLRRFPQICFLLLPIVLTLSIYVLLAHDLRVIY